MKKRVTKKTAEVKSSAPIKSGGVKSGVKKLVDFDINYESVFRNISDGILIHKNGIVVDVNESFLKMFGYKLEEIKGTDSFKNIVDPSSKDIVKNKIAEKYQKPYEIYGRKKNGQVFPIEVNAREFNTNGVSLRIVSCRDITRRKKDEEIAKSKLNELEHLNQLMIGRELKMVELKQKINELKSKNL